MGVLAFIKRALSASLEVTMRMVIILGVTAFAIYLLVSFLGAHPLAVFLILTLTFFPLGIFLYLSCVRAGLVALDATGPPNLKKLVSGTYRLFRFNIMINNLILTLIGLGGTVGFMMYFTPEAWQLFQKDFSFENLAKPQKARELLGLIPVGILFAWALAFAVSAATIGASTGAVAATAAENGPAHDVMWGATRHFWPQFFLSVLVFFPPVLALAYSAGGPLAPFSNLSGLDLRSWGGLALYLVWAGSTVCAGKAVAYLMTVDDMNAERQAREDQLMGEAVPKEDLRALRIARQENLRIKQ